MTTRDRLLVSGIVFLVLAGALWFMLVSPKREEATKLDQNIVTAQADLDMATQQSAQVAAARRNYGLDLAAVSALKEALPDDDQTAQLLFQLNTAAGHSNVKLKAISPGVIGDPAAAAAAAATSTPLPAGVNEMSLDLEFQGTFSDLQRFLARLQRATVVNGESVKVNGRLISVKDISLALDGTGKGGVTAKVTAAAYVTTPPAAAAATDPATAAAGTTAATPPATPAPAPAASAPPVQTAVAGAGG